MLLSSFSSNDTPRIFLATAELSSEQSRTAPAARQRLFLRLVFFGPGVGDPDQRLSGLAILLEEGRELGGRSRRGRHRLLVEERLELRLAEKLGELAAQPLD